MLFCSYFHHVSSVEIFLVLSVFAFFELFPYTMTILNGSEIFVCASVCVCIYMWLALDDTSNYWLHVLVVISEFLIMSFSTYLWTFSVSFPPSHEHTHTHILFGLYMCPENGKLFTSLRDFSIHPFLSLTPFSFSYHHHHHHYYCYSCKPTGFMCI